MSIVTIPYAAASSVTESSSHAREVVSTIVNEEMPLRHGMQRSFRLGYLIELTPVTTASALNPDSHMDHPDEVRFHAGWDTLLLPHFPPKSEKTIRVKVKTIKIDREPPYIPPFDDVWFEG
jgi:hypothetical protein